MRIDAQEGMSFKKVRGREAKAPPAMERATTECGLRVAAND
jgi:hypothetical protein